MYLSWSVSLRLDSVVQLLCWSNTFCWVIMTWLGSLWYIDWPKKFIILRHRWSLSKRPRAIIERRYCTQGGVKRKRQEKMLFPQRIFDNANPIKNNPN